MSKTLEKTVKTMRLDALALLQAEKACRDVISAAAEAVDQQNYLALVDLFTDDASLVRPGGATLNGRAEILATYESKDINRLTQHLICQQSIQVSPAGVAQSRSKVLLYATDRQRDLTPKGRMADAQHQVGVIEDQLLLTDDGWKIKNRLAWFELFVPS
jgi:ketosteroid isomerase-like protein